MIWKERCSYHISHGPAAAAIGRSRADNIAGGSALAVAPAIVVAASNPFWQPEYKKPGQEDVREGEIIQLVIATSVTAVLMLQCSGPSY